MHDKISNNEASKCNLVHNLTSTSSCKTFLPTRGFQTCFQPRKTIVTFTTVDNYCSYTSSLTNAWILKKIFNKFSYYTSRDSSCLFISLLSNNFIVFLMSCLPTWHNPDVTYLLSSSGSKAGSVNTSDLYFLTSTQSALIYSLINRMHLDWNVSFTTSPILSIKISISPK